MWPAFHNGVAAGLRLAREQPSRISSTWIVYNKPTDTNEVYSGEAQHAGFLMALGLQNHLAVLSRKEIYHYLSRAPSSNKAGGNNLLPLTSMALLLGLAAAKCGSRDDTLAKILALHIDALHPSQGGGSRMDIPPTVQAAALVSLGLLYQGSANRAYAELFLQEIGAPASNNKHYDRESYTLSAGIGLGFAMLGQGRRARGLVDLHIEDRLLLYIVGGEAASRTNSHVGSMSAMPGRRRTSCPYVSCSWCHVAVQIDR